jgi:polygalacturonase
LSAGKTLGTAAIQKAVDACNPVGTYLVGNIVLKPNVNLHLKTWVKVWSKS